MTAAPEALDEVLKRVQVVATRFAEADKRLYLVGGIVRDAFMGRELSGDIDCTTDALPAETKKLCAPLADAVWTQGERFGTIGFRIGDDHYEVTTHRGDAYDAASRKPSVEFSSEIEDDLARRDFTVNAIAVDCMNSAVADPFDGQGALRDRVLRTPLDPDTSFSDDPLRVIRAGRFISSLSLTPEPELVEAATRHAERVEIVAIERIHDEIDRIMVLADPASALRFLVAVGVAQRILPGSVDSLAAGAAGESELEASLATLPRERLIRLAWLLTALGLSSGDVERATRELKYSNSDRRDLRLLLAGVEAIAEGGSDADADAEFARRLVLLSGDLLGDVVTLARAGGVDVAPTEAVLAALSEADRDSLAAPLDGETIIAHLGLGGGGPVVGEAMAHLLDLRLGRGPMTHAEAVAALDLWWGSRSASS